MRPTTSFGPLLAGALGHLFWLAAVFGFLRTIVDDVVAAGVAVLLGGLAGHWFAAYFSGGGHSGRRAVNATAVAGSVVTVVGFVLVGVSEGIDAAEGAVLWAVAWLLGATIAVRYPSVRAVWWRVGLVVALGIPLAVVTAALVSSVGVVGLLGLALLAALFPAADRMASRPTSVP